VVTTFNLDDVQISSKALFKKGVESGCQGFIISDKVFGNFLELFFDVFDDSIQVYPNKSLIVYQENMEERIESGWKYSNAIKGKQFIFRSVSSKP
jgi:hypothetical protein